MQGVDEESVDAEPAAHERHECEGEHAEAERGAGCDGFHHHTPSQMANPMIDTGTRTAARITGATGFSIPSQ